MDLEERTRQIAEVMKRTKEDWVASEPENPDLAMYLHFWRDDEMVAVVITRLDRDTGLKAGGLGAKGFNATAMSLTFEGYHSNLAESPLTGKPWRHHEMQYVAQTQPDQDWVIEALTTSVHERGGGFAMFSQVFRVKDNQVLWGEESLHLFGDVDRGEGVMFEYLQQAMAAPTIMDELDNQMKTSPLVKLLGDVVPDSEARLFHSDAATVRVLLDKELAQGVILHAESGSERREWIKERFGDQAEAP